IRGHLPHLDNSFAPHNLETGQRLLLELDMRMRMRDMKRRFHQRDRRRQDGPGQTLQPSSTWSKWKRGCEGSTCLPKGRTNTMKAITRHRIRECIARTKGYL